MKNTDSARDELEPRLDRSTSSVTISPQLAAELENLATASERDIRAATRRRRARTGVIGITVLAALAGAGVTAAAAMDGWEWWAQDPDLSYTYTTPNGAECEVRFGQMKAGADPANLDEGFATWLAEEDILALADVEGMITRLKTEGHPFYAIDLDRAGVISDEDGQETDPEDASVDQLYVRAVDLAVAGVIGTEAIARGIDEWSASVDSLCTGLPR